MSDELDAEPLSDEPFTVRSITVAEVMYADGVLWLTIATTGDPTPWQQLGMIEGAAESVRLATRNMWVGEEEDEDEDG